MKKKTQLDYAKVRAFELGFILTRTEKRFSRVSHRLTMVSGNKTLGFWTLKHLDGYLWGYADGIVAAEKARVAA